MPFLSYATPDEALDNAGRFLREAGAQAVKIEGGVRSARTVETLVKAGIPVMGHIGLDAPVDQRDRQGPRPGQEPRAAPGRCSRDALAIQEAGAFSIVLELVPEQLAAAITERLRIPTIGIGAGAGCAGQVQVVTDLLGLGDFIPRHAKPYADLRGTILAAARAYADEVVAGHVPGTRADRPHGRGGPRRGARPVQPRPARGRHPDRGDPARPRPLNRRADD